MAHFDQLVLKEFPLWTLYLHSNQYYLGRAYAWLTREGVMQRLSQLTAAERLELFTAVMPTYETALEYLWRPDHINYAWLGNEIHVHQGHGHMHIIPRYEKPVRFGRVRFVDEQWGKHYKPYPQQNFSDEFLSTIRDTIRAALSLS